MSSAGEVLKTNLPGAGRPNPSCADFAEKDLSQVFDPDNGYSAGFVLTFGEFRTIDLGDLTWNHEGRLACPTNRIGTIDLYLTTHHGINQSSAPALVHALRPRVAIMNNGTRKGGAVETFQTLESSPGFEDLWQLHWSYNVMMDHNAPGVFVANIDDNATIANLSDRPSPAAPRGRRSGCCGRRPWRRPRQRASSTHACLLDQGDAQQNGTFTVLNARNGFSKTYRK